MSVPSASVISETGIWTEVSAIVLTDLIDVALELFIRVQLFSKEQRIYTHILLDVILTFTIIFKLQDIGGVLRGF